MAVITISRLHGSGGREFGRRLALELGYGYFDKELLTLLAVKLGTGEEQVAFYEVMKFGSPKRLLEVLARKYPSTARDLPAHGAYGEAVRSVVTDIAAAGEAVIIGRGGQAILSSDPGTLHLRAVAARRALVANLSREDHFSRCTEREIEKAVDETNAQRREFILRHFGLEWEDPLHYHLVLNFSRLTADAALGLAAGLASSRGREETPPPP